MILVLLLVLIYLASFPTQQEEINHTEQTSAPTQGTSFQIPFFSSEPKIANGTTISGVDIGDMTEEEAIEALSRTVSHRPEDQDMVIVYGDSKLTLSPADTSAHWDVNSTVASALKGTAAEPDIAFDKNAVQEKLLAFFKPMGGIYSPSGFWLEGDVPDLVNTDEPCQTLVINPGSSGLPVDLVGILEQLQEAYRNDIFEITVEDAGEAKAPKELDLDAIYRQVSVAPVNPSIDHDTLEVIPGQAGYGFDTEMASSLLQQSASSDPIRIQMEYISPAPEEEAWFQEILGCCKTPHTDNENRNENLRLACEKLNGIILQPGDTLSYNETLGKRTAEAGYKAAPAYSGTELVPEIGGGICQVSSTLYLSSLFAELNIVERKNHGFPASYIPLGLDATVNWGTTDLKIRNDYDLPVKILAEVADGYVKVSIMGVDLRDYYVKMEYRVDDHPSYAAAYRCRYDKETDEEISRVLNHTSIYLEDVWCYPGYAQSADYE